MRWKLLRRRLSVSAPRVIVRSHLPWPLRWAVLAVTLGFSAALALWAFEFGKEIAGLDRHAHQELEQLRREVTLLRADRERALSVANTADSLVKTERATQERLAQQVRHLESENQVLQADLGFFEGLLPVVGEGLQLRGFQVTVRSPGQARYQLLLMQAGRSSADFHGHFDLVLSGQSEGRPWTRTTPGAKPLQFRQYARLEGSIELPPDVVLKAVQARVYDRQGTLRANQSAKL